MLFGQDERHPGVDLSDQFIGGKKLRLAMLDQSSGRFRPLSCIRRTVDESGDVDTLLAIII